MKDRIGEKVTFEPVQSGYILWDDNRNCTDIMFDSGVIVNVNKEKKIAVIYAKADDGNTEYEDMISVKYEDIKG